MGQRNFARTRQGAPADQGRVAGRVMRAAKRAFRDEPPAVNKPRDGVDLGGIDAIFQSHARQDRRHATGEHCLARPRGADEKQIV